MKKDKDLLLISQFRRNARESLTAISKTTNIPVSTVFDKLREYERGVISKHTSLLDFRKLGFDLKAHLLFKVAREKQESFQRFIVAHPSVNSAFRINNGYDYMVEGVFRTMKELDSFFGQAGLHGALERQEFFVMQDLLREAFLSCPEGFEGLLAPLPQER